MSKIIPQAYIGQAYGTFRFVYAELYNLRGFAGLTETCGAAAWVNIDQKTGTPGCAGTLLPGVEARVIKADGSEAGFNEPGELLVKMPSLALGYLNNEKA